LHADGRRQVNLPVNGVDLALQQGLRLRHIGLLQLRGQIQHPFDKSDLFIVADFSVIQIPLKKFILTQFNIM
jgi:hypothetical protein